MKPPSGNEREVKTDALSRKTKEKLRTLCDEMAASHDLDDDLRERLGRRMTERARAYLRNDEDMTDDDAYVLIREDLRDRRLLKRILQSLKAEHVRVSLGRRLAAACVATLAVETVLSALLSVFSVSVVVSSGSPYASGGGHALVEVLRFAFAVAGPMLLLATFRRWQRELEQGQALWFVRWRPAVIGLTIGLLLSGIIVVPQVILVPDGTWPLRPLPLVGLPSRYLMLGSLNALLQCLVWLWWCNRPAPIDRAVGRGFAMWVCVQLALRYSWIALPHLTLWFVAGGGAIREPSTYRTLVENLFFAGMLRYCLALVYHPDLVWERLIALMTWMTFLPGLTVYLLYVGVRRIRERDMPPVELDFPWV